MERDLDCRTLLPLCCRFGNNQALVKRWWGGRFSSFRENSWNFMPGHHFQSGNRQAWEGVFFSGLFETCWQASCELTYLKERLLNQILILEGFAQLRPYLLASFFLRILSCFSLTGSLHWLAHVRPNIFLLDPIIIGLIAW